MAIKKIATCCLKLPSQIIYSLSFSSGLVDIDRILGEWGGWAGRGGSSSVPVCSLEGADGGALSGWTPHPTGRLPLLTHHCYDGTRALLLASPVVPASSSIAPVWFCFSVGRPLPFGWMLFGLELARSSWKCKAHCLKCDTCWPPLSSLLGAREPCFPGWQWVGGAGESEGSLCVAGKGFWCSCRSRHWAPAGSSESLTVVQVRCGPWPSTLGWGDLGTRTELKLILGWRL